MGIGASPTSTGGGMKTTTVLVLLVSTWGLLHGKRDTVLFDRRIASETVDKAYNVLQFACCGCLERIFAPDLRWWAASGGLRFI